MVAENAPKAQSVLAVRSPLIVTLSPAASSVRSDDGASSNVSSVTFTMIAEVSLLLAVVNL